MVMFSDKILILNIFYTTYNLNTVSVCVITRILQEILIQIEIKTIKTDKIVNLSSYL